MRSRSSLHRGTSARAIAYQALHDWHPRREFVTDRLDALLVEAPSRERSLARELALGTIRRRATLDALITPHLRRPRKRIEDGLWTLMQLGTYQLAFLAGMADHAAVHETVRLAKEIEPRWTGILNAVLRKAAGSLTDNVLDTPTADGIPRDDGRYRLLTRRLFPDPKKDPAGYFAAAFSFPSWLAARWARRFEPCELFAMGHFLNRAPTVTLRVNLSRTSREDQLARFEQAGIGASTGDHPAAIHLNTHHAIIELPGFAEGHLTVQDETAMHAATTLAPKPGSRVLDLCAAPGTKTTHLAELIANRGHILATDIRRNRLERVGENAHRLGLTAIEPRLIDEHSPDFGEISFEAVLVDVPCSNSGVMGKRPDARWRLRPEDLRELPAIQEKLLDVALDQLARGGRALYSTCSIEPEENEHLVQAVLSRRGDVRLLESRLFLPGRPYDGGFQALIARHSL